MTRLEEIYSHLVKCDSLADVGCDHGYLSKMVVLGGIANKIYATDVSEKCLLKAKELLFSEIEKGVVIPVCTNGLKGLGDIDEIVIAGMGGEEIIQILSEYLTRETPKRIVLQPMKNTQKVRSFLLSNKFSLIKDYTFFYDRKFYDLIVAEPNLAGFDGERYSEIELLYGKDNIKYLPDGFVKKIKTDIKNYKTWLSSKDLKEDKKEYFISKIKLLESLLCKGK